VIRQLAPERLTATGRTSNDGSATGLVAAAAAVRGAAVAASGLLLTAGLALVLWAVTPASGDDVAGALQGGVTAFAAANLMPVVIGGVTLSLPPLLLTAVIAGLFYSTARRGRFMPLGRQQEALSVLLTATAYGLIVAITTRGLATAGAVPAGWVWTACGLALVSTAAGMCRGGSAWHDRWTLVSATWLRLGVRGGWIGLWVLIAGGGIALSAGLIAHFGSAVGVAAIAAPSWTDGLGLAMLGVAYVPNAVIAGVGYVSGVGFEIGSGTYSPLATATVDLPGVPLLAAAPDHIGRSWIGLVFLAVPAVAGYLIARPVVKALAIRSDRLLATGLASVLTGALVAVAAAIARGGIGNGRWSTIGAPPLLVGAVVVAEVGIVALAIAGLAGGRAVPWQVAKVRSPRPATATGGVSVDPDAGVEDDQLAEDDLVDGPTAPGESSDDEAAVDEAPAGEAAVDEAPAGEAAVDEAPVDEEPVRDETVRDEVVPDETLLDEAALDEAAPDGSLDDDPPSSSTEATSEPASSSGGTAADRRHRGRSHRSAADPSIRR
jgi:hypothetical protein